MQLRNLPKLANLVSDRIHRVPLMVVYLTDGCNSRCAMCDIWKSPRVNMDMELVSRLAQACIDLKTEVVLLSGGEALQHPQWPEIARRFREAGSQVWLLTNGLLLKKQADDVIATIDRVTVSLDAATPELYQKIRGVDALDLILNGMQMISANGVPVSTRTTVMQMNYTQMPDIVEVALHAGASSVSFLAVDTVNPYAFGPRFEHDPAIPLHDAATTYDPFGGLAQDDLARFLQVIEDMETRFADQFATGRIEESPAKLRRLYDYFAEPHGESTFEPPRCNAPHISMVVNVDGGLQPCYFLPRWGHLDKRSLQDAINDDQAIHLRQAYRNGQRPECRRCVCPLYRGPRSLLRGLSSS